MQQNHRTCDTAELFAYDTLYVEFGRGQRSSLSITYARRYRIRQPGQQLAVFQYVLQLRRFARFRAHLIWLAASASLLYFSVSAVGTYLRYSHLIDARLVNGQFSDTVNLYCAPERIRVGDRRSVSDVVALLHASGVSGVRAFFDRVEFGADRVKRTISFKGGVVTRIGSRLSVENEYLLPSRLISNISRQSRERRYPLRFSELPKPLIDAVVSAEDKRFFKHPGVDVARIIKAAYMDASRGRKEQGASTLTMQLARSLWLKPDKHWKTKAEETLLALLLELRFSKQEIFEYYANQIYLGQSDTFSIHGFGEAAAAYFGKDISSLNLAECATLGGLIQRPGSYSPRRDTRRLTERRNLVLSLMRRNGYITEEELKRTEATPLIVRSGAASHSELAPWFVDMVSDEIRKRIGPDQLQGQRVYTTLDPSLQQAALIAVAKGMKNVDAMLRGRGGKAQAALVALDPRTGEVLALVGGRDYLQSQLNRAQAMRQTGSVFKPFVYAAALSTAATGGRVVLTPASEVVDEPTTFWFHNKPYEPDNFGGSFRGPVTLRQALEQSLNVATIKVAEKVGYDVVASLARQAGIDTAQGTPSLALGSYEATPLQVAGAYTIFANKGRHLEPWLISEIRTSEGKILYRHAPESRLVLDQRIAYLMTNMLEGVLQNGTGRRVRALGFKAPAGGKTGTSRDGWFAGFTSELLCVVWVGFDDNQDLGLEGSKSALPIWTEFMKGALSTARYANPRPFEVPSGVVKTGHAGPGGAVFLAGTQPKPPARIMNAERSREDQSSEPTAKPASSQEMPLPMPPEPKDVPPAFSKPEFFDFGLPGSEAAGGRGRLKPPPTPRQPELRHRLVQ